MDSASGFGPADQGSNPCRPFYNKMIKIILDTNFPIYLLKFKIRLEEELDRILDQPYKIQILKASIKELEKLNAKLAIKFVERYEQIEPEQGYVDDILADIKDEKILIATQDKKLKQRLQTKKLIIRQKKYLEIKD
jgi:rRNA-processing protein FCF1